MADEMKSARTRLVRLLHLRHLGLDPARTGKRQVFLSNEAGTANALEHALGIRLERVPKGGVGDWFTRDSNGVIDTVYDDCSPAPFAHFEAQFDNWVASLQAHATRKQGVHVVTVDLRERGLTLDQIRRCIAAIEAQPEPIRRKVVYLVNAEDG